MDRATFKKQLDAYFEENREALLEDICTLVRIRSDREPALPGKPYGEGPAACLAVAMEMAEGHGFKTRNYENYVGTVDLNDGPKQLDILAHLDVVPVGDDWKVTGPFEPLVKDGKIYGRGTADDKGPAVAALYAMKAVRDLGVPLTKNVRLILGCDEECGSSDIAYYYKQEEEAPMTFSPDADYPVINIEKGGVVGDLSAFWEQEDCLPRVLGAKIGLKVNVVPDKAAAQVLGFTAEQLAPYLEDAAKATGTVYTLVEEADGVITIQCQGEAAHGSTPEKGNNALTALVHLLATLPCDGKAIEAIRGLAKSFPHGDGCGKAIGIDLEDDISGKLSCSLDLLTITSTGLQAYFDCRAPLCANKDNVVKVAIANLAKNGITMKDAEMRHPHHVSGDSEFVKTLLRDYEEYTGEKGFCKAIGGGTYVHHLKNGVAFGCAVEGVNNRMHADDEFMELETLFMSAKLFAQVIADLCA